MKIVLFYILLTQITCFINSQSSEPELWETFKKTYSKKYANSTDEDRRRSIWLFQKQRIEEHNKRADNGLETYRLAENGFMDCVSLF
jgi:hypothetical protein